MTGAWILLIFVVLATAVMLLLLHLTRLGEFVHTSIPDRPRRRLFLASVSFFVTFLGVRLLVAAITHRIGTFGWVTLGGRHIHHLVWGILILLAVGYAWLAEAGSGSSPSSIFVEPPPRRLIRSGSRAYPRRVRSMAQSCRCLLVAAGSRKHRRRYSVRSGARCRSVGSSSFQCPQAEATIGRKKAQGAHLPGAAIDKTPDFALKRKCCGEGVHL